MSTVRISAKIKKYKKVLNRSHRAEEYNNRIEKCSRRVQQDIKLRRRKDQWAQKQGRWTHPIRAEETKRYKKKKKTA